MVKIGYARVSTTDQNMDRQLEQLKHIDKLFQESISGVSKDRPQLKAMLDYIREGDIVVVTELERLGRNNQELTEIMNQIQTKGATLEVLNLPTLRGIEDDNLRRLLNNLILELYKYQAQAERERIKERQAQGIKIAKAAGVYTGRKIKYGANAKDPRNRWVWQTVTSDLRKKNIPISVIAKKVGISRQQVYRIKKRENI